MTTTNPTFWLVVDVECLALDWIIQPNPPAVPRIACPVQQSTLISETGILQNLELTLSISGDCFVQTLLGQRLRNSLRLGETWSVIFRISGQGPSTGTNLATPLPQGSVQPSMTHERPTSHVLMEQVQRMLKTVPNIPKGDHIEFEATALLEYSHSILPQQMRLISKAGTKVLFPDGTGNTAQEFSRGGDGRRVLLKKSSKLSVKSPAAPLVQRSIVKEHGQTDSSSVIPRVLHFLKEDLEFRNRSDQTSGVLSNVRIPDAVRLLSDILLATNTFISQSLLSELRSLRAKYQNLLEFDDMHSLRGAVLRSERTVTGPADQDSGSPAARRRNAFELDRGTDEYTDLLKDLTNRSDRRKSHRADHDGFAADAPFSGSVENARPRPLFTPCKQSNHERKPYATLGAESALHTATFRHTRGPGYVLSDKQIERQVDEYEREVEGARQIWEGMRIGGPGSSANGDEGDGDDGDDKLREIRIGPPWM